jgi:hypothetical protein
MALTLLEAGHANKLLLSSDFSFERELKKSGGAGFAAPRPCATARFN